MSSTNYPALKLLELAGVSLRAGNYAEAEARLHAVLAHDPANTTALHHLAILSANRGRPAEARTLLERALAAEPNNLLLLASYGTLLHEAAQPREALNVFLRLLALDSARAEIWNAAGICLQETAQPAQAIEFYLRAIGLQPTLAEAYSNLGAVLTNEGDSDGAIENFRHALALKPDFADCYTNLGVALRNRFHYTEAIEAFRNALRLKPDNADIAGSLGEALGLIYHPDALPTLERSVDLRPNDPEKHWNLSLELLKRGDYPRGFTEYEWRWQRTRNQTPLRPFTQPYWRNEHGQSLTGKTILLAAEQGFGDTLQFLRYLPAVLALGPNILLEVPRPLLRLLTALTQTLSPNIHVIAHGDPLPPFDAHIPLMSLPHAFATTIDTIPAPVRLTPICHFDRSGTAPSSRTAEKPAASKRRVGIAWSGNPTHDRDRERSIPLDALIPLFAVPNIEWVSLHIGPATAQLIHSGIAIQQPPIHDFLDTANLIDTLDLVLAVDTAVAHLAATQAAPTWIILPYVADWRWLSPSPQITAEPNPWYPHARIFRQTHLPSGEPQSTLWQPVIAELSKALSELS